MEVTFYPLNFVSMYNGESQVTLDACASLRTGQTFKSSLQDEVNGDLAVLQPRNIAEGKIVSVPTWIDSKKVAALTNHILRKGEILIVNKGTKFNTLIYNEQFEKALATASFFVITPKPGILTQYLDWYLNQPPARKFFAQHAGGSTIPSITKSVLARLPIPLIPIDEQEFIGKVLRESALELELLRELTRRKEEYYNNYIWEQIIGNSHAKAD